MTQAAGSHINMKTARHPLRCYGKAQQTARSKRTYRLLTQVVHTNIYNNEKFMRLFA